MDNRFPGVGPDYCAQACGSTVCEECPRPRLLPDAEFGLQAYLACQTQWAYAPNGQRSGLRYEGCLPMVRLKRREWLAAKVADVPAAERLMADVRVIEVALLTAMSDPAEPATED